MGFFHDAVKQAFPAQYDAVVFAAVAFVRIYLDAFSQSFQQGTQVFAFMGIGRRGVHFLDIAVRIAAGVLFVAEPVSAVFFDPTRVTVFAGSGVRSDLPFMVGLNCLTLFAAGGFNNGGIDNCGLGVFDFKTFLSQFPVDETEQLFEQMVLCQPIAVTAQGAVIGDGHFVKAAEEVEVNAGENAVFEFGIGEAVPLAEQDGFEHTEMGIGGTAAVVADIACFVLVQMCLNGLPVDDLVEFQ